MPTKPAQYRQRRGLLPLILLCVLLGSLIPLRATAAVVELTYSNFFPLEHFNGRLAAEWCRAIEGRTGGRVRIAYFAGGALLKGSGVWEGVLGGQRDLGMSCFAYSRERFPVMEALDLPLGYTSGDVATRVANDFVARFEPEELKPVHVLYLHAHGPGVLHTLKPVRRLEDLQGMRVRANGFSAKMAAALGAEPLGMSQWGTYEALEKGIVEGTFAPMEALKGWDQARVIRFTTDCYSIGYTTAMFVIMNRDAWRNLPPDIQAVFTAVSREWVLKTAREWDLADAQGRAYSLSLGNRIIELEPQESARWVKAAAPVLAEYVRLAHARGLPGQSYIDFIRDRIKTYTSESHLPPSAP